MIQNGKVASLEVDVQKMSAEERKRYKEKAKEELISDDIDLKTYRREQIRNRHSSLLGRVVAGYKTLVGRTPARMHKKLVDEASRYLAQLETGYQAFDRELEKTIEQKADVAGKLTHAETYFDACIADYGEILARTDRLEAEIETIDKQAQGRMVTSRLELATQLTNATKLKINLKNETENAKRTYQTKKAEYFVLDERESALEFDLLKILDQKSAAAGVIADANINQIKLGGNGPSVVVAYERAAIAIQKLRNFSAEELGEKNSFDENYRIRMRGEEPDELIEKWNKLKE